MQFPTGNQMTGSLHLAVTGATQYLHLVINYRISCHDDGSNLFFHLPQDFLSR